jgi:F-type H+-transporting ATPase subunit alpha
LTPKRRRYLTHGAVVTEALKQKNFSPLTMEDEELELYAVKGRFLDDLELEEVNPFLADLVVYLHDHHKELVARLVKEKKFDDAMNKELDEAITTFKGLRKK